MLVKGVLPKAALSWFYDQVEAINKKLTKKNLATITYTVDKTWQPNSGSVALLITVPLPEKIGNSVLIGRVFHAWEDLPTGLTYNNTVHYRKDTKIDLVHKMQIAPPHCDHCGVKRYRTETFFIQTDDTVRQVGSTCVNDFFSDATALDKAQLLGLDDRVCSLVEEACALFPITNIKPLTYTLGTMPLKLYLAEVMVLIEERGWVSKAEAALGIPIKDGSIAREMPTYQVAAERFKNNETHHGARHHAFVEQVLSWVEDNRERLEQQSDFIRNASAMFAGVVVKAHQMPTLAAGFLSFWFGLLAAMSEAVNGPVPVKRTSFDNFEMMMRYICTLRAVHNNRMLFMSDNGEFFCVPNVKHDIIYKHKLVGAQPYKIKGRFGATWFFAGIAFTSVQYAELET